MQYTDLLRHYKTQTAAAADLKVDQSTVARWKKRIPDEQQFRIERITNGALVAEPKIRRKWSRLLLTKPEPLAA